MSYNFINEAASIGTSSLCKYDTVAGFASDFTTNSDVDGWDYYDGIHTYGSWNGFLFGTLYGDYALLGRNTVFKPVSAETHYNVRIAMKINIVGREGSHPEPTTGRIMWVTLNNPVWGTDKFMDFTVYPDNMWHEYNLNMGAEQWWQGDVNNLRVYPILTNGQDGDEFFIKTIDIVSVDTYSCNQIGCSYYNNYSHPCGGVGTRGYRKSSSTGVDLYNIEEGVNDELILNINGYGSEVVRLDPVVSGTGPEVSKLITKAASKVAIGGYSEIEVSYTDNNEFIIYSGTYAADSTVEVEYNNTAVIFGFFNEAAVDLSSGSNGSQPASGFSPSNSFKIKSFQLLNLFDGSNDTAFEFDPSIYNIEGGRRDWLDSGLGISKTSFGDAESSSTAQVVREYNVLDNTDKTIIDYNHPFNASGRIRKITAAITLDQGWDDLVDYPKENFAGRMEATGCKFLILRPKKNGNLKVVGSVDISDRDYSSGRLYSQQQEYTEIDCDLWVNKGDFLGIYNANVYIGKSSTGEVLDALYYHVGGEATGEFVPGKIYGDGVGGLLIYARSSEVQDKLVIDVDLGNRVNIEEVNIIGSAETTHLEFNVARCLDVNWDVDFFGHNHITGYVYTVVGSYYHEDLTFTHNNVGYGLNCLSDGIRTAIDGFAADSYSLNSMGLGQSNEYGSGAVTPGIAVTNPSYFMSNGDGEWVGVYQHIGSSCAAGYVDEFVEDPIAFTLLFPYGTSKKIYKSAIYFKEKHNFRDFALSVVYNLNDVYGTADDPRFHLISEYSAVTIDDRRIEKDGPGYDDVNLYLFTNPSFSQPEVEFTGEVTGQGGRIGYITNNEANLQANNTDWNTIIHEFEPIECKGFRYYCNYHESTKICEMELYCYTEDVGSSMVGSVYTSSSHYGDLWWSSSLNENPDTSVTAFIGDTPRYISIEIRPITKMKLNEIRFDVKYDDVYMGTKGCQYDLLPIHSKIGSINDGTRIDIENVYEGSYDLYVNIAEDAEAESGIIFYSSMHSADSITTPQIGPNARYHKENDYLIRNDYRNCAINNQCYGLRNLIDGKTAYYSILDEHSYQEFGTLSSGESVDFENIPNLNMTVINLPILYRNRYWKLGFLCDDHAALNVREMKIYYEDEEVECTFYHDKDLPYEIGPISDTAPHLSNNSPVGSYYDIKEDYYIGMDLGCQGSIDKIVLFHDSILEYDNYYCGVDFYTQLYLIGKDGDIIDYSYYQHTPTVGDGIYTAGTVNGRWDRYEKTAVYGVDGLYGSDATPTSGTLSSTPEFVDGVIFDANSEKTMQAYYSSGIDFGAPTSITALHYSGFINTYSALFATAPRYYVYSSNDGVNWTLIETLYYDEYATQGPHMWYSQYSSTPNARYYSRFVLPLNGIHTARYFKLFHTISPEAQYWTKFKISEIYGEMEELKAIPATGIKFSGTTDSEITIPYFDAINPAVDGSNPGNPMYVDFWFKMDSLPVNDGDYVVLASNWLNEPPDRYPTGGSSYYINTTSKVSGDSWLIIVRNDSGNVAIEFWIQWYMHSNNWRKQRLEVARTVNPYPIESGKWYEISFYFTGNNFSYAWINSQRIGHIASYGGNPACPTSATNDLVIGNNLDGIISDFRISSRTRSTHLPYYWGPYEHYYAMSLYVSNDNLLYGKYLDVDTRYDNPHHYYSSDNVYSQSYNSYFVIDLARRYDIDWIRSYGDSDKYELSFYGTNRAALSYSNEDIDDVNQVTFESADDYANQIMLREAEWYDWAPNYPDPAHASVSFSAINCGGLTKENGIFKIDIRYRETYSGDFDRSRGIFIEITSTGGPNSEEWSYFLSELEIGYWTNNTWYTLYLPFKYFDSQGGELDVSAINYIRLTAYRVSGATDGFYLDGKNAEVLWDVRDVTALTNDVRWLRVKLPNDGTTRIIRKLGLYPNISTRISPAGGAYNHEWDVLGTSVTNYEDPTNLALSATVTGSSYFGMMSFDKINDGVIDESYEYEHVYHNASFDNSWGSSGEINPWIIIDLGAVYDIYRVKLYHGYDGVDTAYIIEDYTVRTSVDDQEYYTQISVTNNSSFERTHDFTAVPTRYVKIEISDYKSTAIFLRANPHGDIESFVGAVLREVEIYQDYGITSVNSEDYPVICINLNDQFYISSHNIIGLDVNDQSQDWSNANHNFTYSNYIFNEPQKIGFREWDSSPGYDQWVAVRMDTAENYYAGPHYLKHIRVKCAYDQNPCDFPWWWSSNLSTLSRDYGQDVENCISSLKIEYPASTNSDTIYFLEGDDFGIDTFAAWRDGLNVRLKIDNIDNIDLSYGYLYLGGYDYTTAGNPIKYKWYFSTLSGSLDSGWSNLFLRFKTADEIEYTALPDERSGDPDPRIVDTITLGKLGMVFRGVGNPLTMHLDGFKIRRNHFQDYSSFNNGLYLSNDDYLVCPIGEFEMSRGTIEFWLRADYDHQGFDFYNRLKNRAIFHFGNNANDIFGMMFTYDGMEIYCGNLSDEIGVNSFVFNFDWGASIMDTTFHMAVVFSNDGTQIHSDSSTIRVYMSNTLVGKIHNTWNVYDNKHFNFILGGKGPLALKVGKTHETGSVDGVISNFKIYNYCKTDFYDSISGREDPADNIISPSSLIEVSRDNLTYYKVREGELPFKFEAVQPGVVTPIYVRTILPNNLSGYEKRTSGLLVYWDLGV